jgi:hypothetical protein
MPTLNDVLPDLIQPFPSDLIELKPAALNDARDRALALAYADPRAYQDRLDAVVGPAAWHVAYQLTPDGVICTLTILDVTKADVGDYPSDYGDTPNDHKTTTAAAQAFKRACASFGIGRYLYQLPRTWAAYDAERRRFRDPQGVILALYRAADLAAFITDTTARSARHHDEAASDAAPSADPSATPHASRTPSPRRLARAPTALAAARPSTRSATTPDAASEAQLGLIARLIRTLHQQANDAAVIADAIDALGERFQLANFSRHASPEQLRALALAKRTASELIERLKTLETPRAAPA